MEQKNAWIYCRIDAPEDTHGALKGQYEQLERYAEQMGFTVVGSSQDLGNGLNMERPGLLAVREAIKAQNAQVLLVSSVSRIGRDTTSTIGFIKILTGSGARIFSPLEGEITAAPFLFKDVHRLSRRCGYVKYAGSQRSKIQGSVEALKYHASQQPYHP